MTLLRNRVIGGDILGSEALLFIRIPQKVSTEEQEGISNAADCMRGMRVSSSLKPIGLSRQCSACQVLDFILCTSMRTMQSLSGTYKAEWYSVIQDVFLMYVTRINSGSRGQRLGLQD